MLQLTTPKNTELHLHTQKHNNVFKNNIWAQRKKNDYYRKPAENLQKTCSKVFSYLVPLQQKNLYLAVSTQDVTHAF